MEDKYLSLESANDYVRTLSERDQALIYKALYLNDMRIDKAESIIIKPIVKTTPHY